MVETAAHLVDHVLPPLPVRQWVLSLGLNLAIRELEIGQAEEAVVLEPQMDVMSAPVDDETLTIFTVHEGTKVRVDRHAEEWAEVVLEDGKVGWVRVDVLETI